MRPPRSRTWGRRGITPVISVRGGGAGHVSVAGLACYRPGHRCRLIYRLHSYRGRKDETKAFTWIEYRDLLIAAHRQLPGGNIVLIWDNLNVHKRAELRAFTGAQPWLRVFWGLRARAQPRRPRAGTPGRGSQAAVRSLGIQGGRGQLLPTCSAYGAPQRAHGGFTIRC